MTINLFGGILILLAAAIALPPFGAWLRHTFNVTLSGSAKARLVIGLIVLAVLIMASGGLLQEAEADRETAQVETQTAAARADSLRQDFATNRGAILGRMDSAFSARDYALAVSIGIKYAHAVPDTQLARRLLEARAAQKTVAPNTSGSANTIVPGHVALQRARTTDGRLRAQYVQSIENRLHAFNDDMVVGVKGAEANTIVIVVPGFDQQAIGNLAGNPGTAGVVTHVTELQERGFSEMDYTNGDGMWGWTLKVILSDGRDWTSIGPARKQTAAYRRILAARMIDSVLFWYGSGSVVIARDTDATTLAISNSRLDSLQAAEIALGNFQTSLSTWQSGAFSPAELRSRGFRSIVVSNGRQRWTFPL